MCFQCAFSGLPVASQWSSSVFQLCKLPLDCYTDTTGCLHQSVLIQWHSSVLVAPVVFQCIPIMQITTGLPLEDHWVIASASVVPVYSSDIPVYWQHPFWSYSYDMYRIPWLIVNDNFGHLQGFSRIASTKNTLYTRDYIYIIIKCIVTVLF